MSNNIKMCCESKNMFDGKLSADWEREFDEIATEVILFDLYFKNGKFLDKNNKEFTISKADLWKSKVEIYSFDDDGSIEGIQRFWFEK